MYRDVVASGYGRTLALFGQDSERIPGAAGNVEYTGVIDGRVGPL